MIGCGSARFAEVLAGAYDMDCHFRTAQFDQNLPVIMGLLRIWHRQFMGRVSYGLMAYDHGLPDLRHGHNSLRWNQMASQLI